MLTFKPTSNRDAHLNRNPETVANASSGAPYRNRPPFSMARAEPGAVIIGRHVLSSVPVPEGPAVPGVPFVPSLLTKKNSRVAHPQATRPSLEDPWLSVPASRQVWLFLTI